MKKKLILTATSLSLATLVAFQGVAEADTVKVQSGDTLWSISKKYDVSLNEFMKWNKLSSTAIYVGQNLSIPGTTEVKQNAVTQKQVNTSANDPLNIRSGAGVSYKTVGKLNNKTVVRVHSESKGWSYIEGNGIKGYVNSKYLVDVKVSTPPASGNSTSYIVKKGDTLYRIATNHKVSIANIKSWNNLNTDSISVGQKLTVSKAATPPVTTISSPSTPATPSTSKLYTVKKGDTLFRVAVNSGISVSLLKQMNGLSSDVIHVGQTLKVSQSQLTNPAEGTATSQYGYRNHPVNGIYKLHAGIDIAKSGTVPIVAFYDGVVTRSEYHVTYGNVVFMMHTIDGKKYESVYAHMRNRAVVVGTQVKQGQQLGLMGATGNVTGQHLHFEIHEDKWLGNMSNSIDPRRFVY